MLGGVEIPGEPGLAGHSDADVVAHAVIDAVLGAAGLGDIGDHFPDHDPRWANADSIELLGIVAGMLTGAGWRTANVDVTVIAERRGWARSRPRWRSASRGRSASSGSA